MNTRPVFFRVSRNRRKAASAPSMRPKALSGSIAKYSRGLALSALSALTLIGVPSAQATVYYWDDDAALLGFGTAGASTGTWEATTAGTIAGWSLSATGVNAFAPFATTTADNLNFGNGAASATGLAAGPITVSGTVNAGNITFAGGSGVIALSGGTINLAAASTIIVDNASNTISSILTGAGTSLTKAGTGQLILSGANTYTGTTIINAGGGLVARNGSAFSNGNVTVAAGARMHYNAATDVPLNIGGTLAVTASSGNTYIGGSIGSTFTSARINVAGNATTTASNIAVNIYGNSFSGTTSGNGTYTLVQGLDGGATNLSTASYLAGIVYNATNFTVGALSKTTTTVDVAITTATPLTSAYWRGTASAPNNLAPVTKVWAASYGTSNWSSTATGSVQSLVPGSGADVFISTTSGALGTAPTDTTLGADMSIKTLTIQDTANGLGLNADGYTLTITPLSSTVGITMNASVPASTIAANVALGASQTWTNNSVNSLTVSGRVSGGNDLTKAGTGTIILSGSNTYTGATTVSAGTLILSGLNTGGGATTISAGTLQIGNGGTTGSLSPSSAITNNAALVFNRANTITQGTHFANTIGGTGTVTQAGTGTLVLSGSNSYGGVTNVNSGTLNIQHSNALGTAANTITVASGAKLQLQNGITVPSDKSLTISQPGSVVLASGGTEASSGVYTVRTFTSNGSLTVTSGGTVEYLVIAGGGAGGRGTAGTPGGGGGGGGFLTGSTAVTTSGASITVGAGGVASGTNGNIGTSGSDSVLAVTGGSTVTSKGGGYGGAANSLNGGDGGSGGGGAPLTGTGGTANGTPTSQGTAGGASSGSTNRSGGGGGAGQAGAVGGTSGPGGKGGDGLASSITGTSLFYAGGGAGNNYNLAGSPVVQGGAGGGGGANANLEGYNATFYGGGGGGSGGHGNAAGNGFQGVVIVRYVGSAALENVSGNNTFSGAITLGSSIGINSLQDTLTLGGAIGESGSGYGITKIGAGTLALTGTNTYTGATSILQGTLIARNGSAFGTTGTANVTVATQTGMSYYAATDVPLNIGGTLDITGGSTTTIGASIGSGTTSAQINVTGAATISDAAHTVNIYGNSFSGGAGTYTLITGGGGSSLNPATAPTLGLVFNNTNFTINPTGGDSGASAFARTATTLGVAISAATPLTAGDVFWKGGLAGATGVWSASNGTTQSNWQVTDTVNQPLAPNSTNDLVFSTATAPGTMAGMTLGSDMSVRTLTINNTSTAFGLLADGYTLTITPTTAAAGITIGSNVLASSINTPVALGAAQTWTNNSANPLTFSGRVSGGNDLTKAGTGTIILSGANGYTGLTTVSGGTLNIQSATATGTIAGGVIVSSGGKLQLQHATGIAVGAETLSLGANGTFAATGGTVSLATISGTAYELHTFTTTGTTSLTSSLTLNVAKTVEYLVVGGGGGGGASTNNSFYGSGGGGAGGMLTGSIALSAGSQTVTVGGGGAGGANTFAGTKGSDSVFGALTAVGGGFGGAAYGAGGSGGSGGGAGGYSSAVGGREAGPPVQGNVGGVGGADKGGGGGGAGAPGASGATRTGGIGLQSSITGVSTYYAGGGGGGDGSNGSSAGGLGGGGGNNAIGSDNFGGGGGGGQGNSAPGQRGGSGIVIVRIANDVTILPSLENVSGNNSWAGAITLTGSIVGISSLQDTLTLGGAIGQSSSGFGITKLGAGTVALGGTNTYTGLTTISAGTLSVGTIGNGGVAGNLGQATNAVANLVFDGGTLQYTGATASTDRSFTINTGKTATFDITTNTLTVSGASAATDGALTKIGAGTLTLSGANTYTGLTTISNGTLKLGATGGATNTPLGTTAVGTTVSGTGTLDLNGFTLGTAEALSLSGTGTSNSGALANSAAGAATYSGLVTLGGSASIVAGSGAGANIILSNVGIITGAGFDLTLSGTATGSSIASIIGTTSGTVTKQGAGAWTLSGANTYTGLTTISNGTLKLGATGDATNTPLGTTAAGTTVSGTGTMDLNGFTLGTAEALSLSGTGTGGSGALANSATTAATYSGLVTLGGSASIVAGGGTGANIILSNAGTISGPAYNLTLGGTATGSSIASIIGTTSGTVTKQGTGTWTLSGANTYTGLTTVSVGALNIQNDTATGTIAGGVSVTANAALQIQNNITVGDEALTLNGTGIGNTGALRNISGTNFWRGTVTLGSAARINSDLGSLTFNTAANSITAANQNLTLGGAGSGTVAGTITTGSGTLTKDGLGTWTLSGANNYTGLTTVSAGVLNIQNATATGTIAGGVTVSTGGKLQLQNNITVGAETLSLGLNRAAAATGGTASFTTIGGITYELRTFTTTGTTSLTSSLTVVEAGTVDFLIVGGGGAGGSNPGAANAYGTGGGGAGGLITSVGNSGGGTPGTGSAPSAPLSLTAGTYAVTVGGGGSAIAGVNGGDSVFNGITAKGGGNGGNVSAAGNTGGSGGGKGFNGSGTGASGTSNQGFNGGNSTGDGGGGGGGAGNVGAFGNGSNGGGGGAGLTNNIDGTNTVYAGGGGGASAANGAGGSGGGGSGGAGIGTDGRGGGGGGVRIANAVGYGGNGGSGIVIVRLVASNIITASLENVSGNNTWNGAITLTGSTVGISSLQDTLTLGGAIGDSGSGYGITKLDAGTVALGGSNTYTGATTISAGTLEVKVNNALGTIAAGTTVASGATLKLTDVTYSTAEGLTINGAGVGGGGALLNSGTSTFAGLITALTSATINAGGGVLNLTGGLVKNGTTLTFTGGGSINISSVISGASDNSDLVVDATSTTLNGANTYNGPTTITNGGTLIANVLGALPLSPTPRSAVSFTGSGNPTLNLGASQEVASLSSSTTSAVVNLSATGTNTLTVGAASGTTTFTGSIGGTSGNLIKDGASTQVLTGTNNTYTGTTTVNAGTLEVQGTLSGTSAVTVNDGGTLLLNSGASNSLHSGAAVTVGSGSSGILKTEGSGNIGTSAGALTLTSNSTIDFSAGTGNTLTFASLASLGGAAITISNWTGSRYAQGTGITDSGGPTQDRLLFTTGLGSTYTDGELFNQITFTNDLGAYVGFGQAIAFGGGGGFQIVPVPEPATTALIGAIALCALIGYRERRRFTGFGKRMAARK